LGKDGVKVRVWAHTLALEPACQLRNQDVATSCHGALPDSTIARLSLCICKSSPELLQCVSQRRFQSTESWIDFHTFGRKPSGVQPSRLAKSRIYIYKSSPEPAFLLGLAVRSSDRDLDRYSQWASTAKAAKPSLVNQASSSLRGLPG
jgi:hypothetical protein